MCIPTIVHYGSLAIQHEVSVHVVTDDNCYFIASRYSAIAAHKSLAGFLPTNIH